MRPARSFRPGVVALALLAPFCGELLSGSTPPLGFVGPFALYLIALYGGGALVARELVRGRGLGWGNLLLLGAAYGVLEEGLVVTSWTNPLWPDAASLGDRGRVLDIGWIWAVGLTVYHAVVSVTIPVVLAEALFPRDASRPWLSSRALRWTIALLGVASVLGLLLFGFLMFRDRGYAVPASYLLVVAIAAALVRLGLRPMAPARRRDVEPPGLWTVRASAFLATVAFFVALWIVPGVVDVGIVPIAAVLALVWLAARAVSAWAATPGWGAAGRLALASGALAFFVALSPLIELGRPGGKDTRGEMLAAALTVVFLVWLARRIEARPAAPAASASPR